jgi:hypothetical protein
MIAIPEEASESRVYRKVAKEIRGHREARHASIDSDDMSDVNMQGLSVSPSLSVRK